MKMIQTSVCTVRFVENHIKSCAPSKNTFIMIMVWTVKPQKSYTYSVSLGTQCNPATSNSPPVNDIFNPNQQEAETDDYLDEDDNCVEDEKWKCAKFLLHVTEEHHLTHDGVTNLTHSVQWLIDSLFSQVKERMSAHLSETQGIDKETLLKMCEPGDIFWD